MDFPARAKSLACMHLRINPQPNEQGFAFEPLQSTGGMGPLLGDGGNGYSLGAAALAAAVKSSDGRGADSLCEEPTARVL